VNALSFSRYALDAVFRNRRRSVYALIGVAIAVSLVSGSSISVDSSVYGMVRSVLDPIPADFVGYVYPSLDAIDESSFSTTVEKLESVNGISAAVPVITVSLCSYLNDQGELYTGPSTYSGLYWEGAVMFIPSYSEPLLDRNKIEGAFPDRGTVAVPNAVAEGLGLVVGDTITCSFRYWEFVNATSWAEAFVNETFEVGAIWRQTGDIESLHVSYGYGDWIDGDVIFADNVNPILVRMDGVSPSFETELLQLAESGAVTVGASYQVMADRDDVIDAVHMQQTIEWYDFTSERLTSLSSGQVSYYFSPAMNAISGLGADLLMNRVLFLGLSAPVIALGAYLSMVGVELGVNDRRREAGILKARGASNGNVFGGLMLEASILGAVAGLCGFLGGLGVSRFLVTTVISDSPYDYRVTDLYISPQTLALSVALAVLLMLVSAYRPMKRVAKMDISEMVHHYTPSTTRLDYRARYDIAAIILVAINVWTVLYWSEGYYTGTDSLLVSLFLAVLFVVGISVTPFMPFLLSVGLSRLLTRGPGELYRRFVRIVRPWTKELHYIVEKNISRNPRRASNMSVIISLAMAFGLVISVTLETNIAYARALAIHEVGSDIRVSGYSYDSAAPDLSEIDAVSDLPGVEAFCRFHMCDSTMSSQWTSVAVFDPGDYQATVQPSESYFEDGDSSVLNRLEAPGTIVVTEFSAEARGWLVGDMLKAEFWVPADEDGNASYEVRNLNLTIVGLTKDYLPGLSSAQSFASLETLAPVKRAFELNPNGFVKVADGYDHESVASSVLSSFAAAGVYAEATLLQDRLEQGIDEPALRSVANFLYVEYVLAFVIMTSGLGLIVFATVSDREREIACIMARGSSSSQMRRMLMGESMSIMALGLVIGLSVGLLSSYLFNLLLTDAAGSAIPHDLVFSSASYAIVLASMSSFFIASYLATARAGKVRLAEVLRIRGG
jgi:ABC-type lipoprotein release transport system permease subunit